MLLALHMSVARGLVHAAEVEGLWSLLRRAGLPLMPPTDMDAARFLGLMARDKKVLDGRLRDVALRGIGHAVIVDDVDRQEINALLGGSVGI